MTGNENVGFKPQVKHILSKELMLYFEKIQTAILDPDTDEDVLRLRSAALASVENDESLQQLVPYMVSFVAEKVTHNTKNVFILQTMMELTSALTHNDRLFVDPYIHYLGAPVLTCLIGRGMPNASQSEIREHYKLRDYTASLAGHIGRKYGNSNRQLKPRLARALLKAFLGPEKPLDVHYGAIMGLAAVCGPEGVRMLIIPNLKAYDKILARGVGESGASLDAEMVVGALVGVLKSMGTDSVPFVNGSDGKDYKAELEEFLGPIVGRQIAGLGDRKLARVILECRN
jgi:transcription initiation factor TFIID subunit 6